MPTVLITGGTGLIGTALSQRLLNEGYNVIVLSRHPQETAQRHDVDSERNFFRSSGNIFYAGWNIRNMSIDAQAFAQADFVVHLAGAGIADRPWTEARKKEIVESRTRSSELLLKYLKTVPNKVQAVVSVSAIGWYGADQGKIFTEEDPPADDFLGQTCLRWEQSIEPVTTLGKRLVKLRSGIVLSNDGGALAEFKKPVRFGIAAVLGDGEQIISWVHIDDLCSAFVFALENTQMQGAFNVTAPETVTNKELILQLAGKMKGKRYIRTKISAKLLRFVMGEMSVEILKSASVSSEKIRREGFSFRFPSLTLALNDLIRVKHQVAGSGVFE